jgi:antitoxin Phd
MMRAQNVARFAIAGPRHRPTRVNSGTEIQSRGLDRIPLLAGRPRFRYDHCGHGPGLMRKIQLKDAKAKLSAVVDQATRGKPSVITRHGKPEAVVLGFADWERLSKVPSFGRLLTSAPLEPGDLPERDDGALRDAGL